MPVLNAPAEVARQARIENVFGRQIGVWEYGRFTGTEGWHWSDKNNNVWINPQSREKGGGYVVFHRHTGGTFPRLFPLSWAPNHVWCLTQDSAIKHAAQMVMAYKRARIMGPKVWKLIDEEERIMKKSKIR